MRPSVTRTTVEIAPKASNPAPRRGRPYRGLSKALVRADIEVLEGKFLTEIRPWASEITMVEDPVKVDPKHYKVEFENDKVRVLRIRYGPGEKSIMHGHPKAVAVFLADAGAKFTYPDGKTEDVDMKAGQAMWFPAVEHLPEERLGKSIELVFVELK